MNIGHLVQGFYLILCFIEVFRIYFGLLPFSRMYAYDESLISCFRASRENKERGEKILIGKTRRKERRVRLNV